MKEFTPEMKASMCRSSIATELAMCAQNFWYWAPNYVQTRDEENQSIRYFPKRKWEGDVRDGTYLSDIGDEIDEHQVTIILKSRRLLVTWRMLLRFMHKAQFAGSGIPDTSDAFTAAVLTVDEEAAKHLLGKVYAVYDLMPPLLKEFNPIIIRNSLHCKFKLGGEIQGFSLKQSGQRSFGFSEILFDEAAFQMYARSTYEGARPTIGAEGKMILVSTPNGKRNFFYKVWANEDGDFHNIHRIKLDWDVHPDRDSDWLERIRGSMPEQGFNREYLCSFTTAAGKAVYKDEYDSVMHETDNKSFLSYQPDRPVLIGWDLGYWAPAVVLGQMNNKDQFIGQHEFFGFQEDIYAFAGRFRLMRASWYPPEATYIHIVPHDAFMSYRATSKQGHANDYQTLFAHPSIKASIDPGMFFGETAMKGKVNINERISSVRKLLRLRDDGRPGAVFSKKGCPDLIDGFKGGYAYPEEAKVKDGSKLQPEKGDFCVPLYAQMLTMDGWKMWRELSVGNDIPVFNMKTGDMESGKIQAVNVFEGIKQIYKLSNNEIEFPCTANHRHVIETKSGVRKFVSTVDLKQGNRLISPPAMKCPPKLCRFTREFIVIAAWAMAEGHYRPDGSIVLTQSIESNPAYVEYLSGIMDNNACVNNRGTCMSHPDRMTWHITKELAYFIRKMIPTYEKVPTSEFIMAMNNNQKRLFLYEFMRGDGHAFNGTGGRYMPDKQEIKRKRDFFVSPHSHRIFQSSRGRIDALQMMATMCGINSAIRNKGDGYQITLFHGREGSDFQFMNRRNNFIVGDVWCPTTTHGTWVCRVNGRVFVTGNSHLHDALQEIATGYQGIIYMQKHRKKGDKPQQSIASRTGRRIGT